MLYEREFKGKYSFEVHETSSSWRLTVFKKENDSSRILRKIYGFHDPEIAVIRGQEIIAKLDKEESEWKNKGR